MNNPADMFFSLGDKATKGDPYRKALFDYILLWVMFLAFCGVMTGNFYEFYLSGRVANLGWGLFSIAILWFQYFTLKTSRNALKALEKFKNLNKRPEVKKEENLDIESEEDMLKGFKQ